MKSYIGMASKEAEESKNLKKDDVTEKQHDITERGFCICLGSNWKERGIYELRFME